MGKGQKGKGIQQQQKTKQQPQQQQWRQQEEDKCKTWWDYFRWFYYENENMH